MPPAQEPTADRPRLFFPVTTTDARDYNVDAPPTLPASAATSAPPKAIGVRLRPGAKVTYTTSWWAFRIPAPPPIVVDDAGHRYVTKTLPAPLWPGDYTVKIELPLHDVPAPERTVSGRVRVEPSPSPKKKPQ
jgi:hypothetical protein